MQQLPPFSDLSALNGAIIVDNYRYVLWRIWNPSLPRVLFIMLNPSTADQIQNDATLRRCIHFAQSWSCGSIEVVNLFAFRSTNPSMLAHVADPVGPENNTHIQQAIRRASLIVCAWGAYKNSGKRVREVLKFLEGREVYCFGCTREGNPRHPLYVPAISQLLCYP